MKLEIMWDENCYYIIANNPIQGCLQVLDMVMESRNGDFPIEPFRVCYLDGDSSGESEVWGMADVLRVRSLSNQYVEEHCCG